MALTEKATQAKLDNAPSRGLEATTEGGIFHISRCESCGRLLTKLEIVAALDTAHSGGGWKGICRCGASRFRPSYPRGVEWLAPRVIRMAWAVWKGEVQPGESR